MEIHTRWLYDGQQAPYPATVIVEGNTIAAIEPLAEDSGEETLLTVGLANAHLHLDLTTSRPDEKLSVSFPEWLEGIVSFRKGCGSAGLTEAAAGGVHSSLNSGVTLLFDFDPAGWSLEPLSKSPIRRVVFREVIALTTDDLESRHSDWNSFLEHGTAETRELRSLAPHAPYTVHPTVLGETLRRVEQQQLPWAMHVSEQRWEEELLETAKGEGARFLERFGADPQAFRGEGTAISRLAADGALDSRALIIHGNYLSETELDLIAEHGAAVVYCPRSHQYFGHEEHPLPRLLARGIPTFFGTDGAISAGDLNLLSELRAAHQAFPTIDVRLLWHGATRGPREFLGGRFGSGRIETGAPADLCLWAIPPGEEDPLRRALKEETRPLEVWIDGRSISHP